MPVEKKCVICGAAFRVPPVRAGTAKTCSLTCRGKLIAQGYERKRVALTCPSCKRPFSVAQCDKDRRKFCSDKCATPARASKTKRETHYAWAGGIAKHTDGYRYVSVPGHPFGWQATHYVFEHRMVVELLMRQNAPDHPFLVEIAGEKYLSPGIAVHHINSNKRDNRPSNLVACTSAAHRDIHNGKAPMRGEVWPEVAGLEPYEPRMMARRCEVCATEFYAKRSAIKRGGGKFCSRDCYNKRVRNTFEISI